MFRWPPFISPTPFDAPILRRGLTFDMSPSMAFMWGESNSPPWLIDGSVLIPNVEGDDCITCGNCLDVDKWPAMFVACWYKTEHQWIVLWMLCDVTPMLARLLINLLFLVWCETNTTGSKSDVGVGGRRFCNCSFCNCSVGVCQWIKRRSNFVCDEFENTVGSRDCSFAKSTTCIICWASECGN